MRTLVATLKISAYLILTVLCIPVQFFLLRFAPFLNPYAFPQWYHRVCCSIFQIKIVVEGEIEQSDHVIFISNHVSYLDIPVIASRLRTAFIAKADVAAWPLFGTLGRLQKTLFISRNPRHAQREKEAFLKRLEDPFPMVLFAEGTNTMGDQIKPFKSTLFEVFLNKNIKLQPMTLSILEIDGIPARGEAEKEVFAWGDIEIPPHIWRFAKTRGAVIKLTFHETILSSYYTDRKLLSEQCYERVLEGLDLSPTHA